MLVHSLAWRKLHNIDRLLETYKTPEIMETYYPGGWHYFDRGKCSENCYRIGFLSVFFYNTNRNMQYCVIPADTFKRLWCTNSLHCNYAIFGVKTVHACMHRCRCIHMDIHTHTHTCMDLKREGGPLNHIAIPFVCWTRM